MQKCPNCSHQNRLGVIFCEQCGASLIGEAPLSTKALGVDSPSALRRQTVLPGVAPRSDVFLQNTILKLEIEGSDPLFLKNKREVIFGRRDPTTGAMPDVDLTPFAGYRMGVSRKHAAIRQGEGNRLELWDLGSSNGTYLNGVKLAAHRPNQLRDGDEIRLGQMVIRIFFVLTQQDAPATGSLGSGTGPLGNGTGSLSGTGSLASGTSANPKPTTGTPSSPSSPGGPGNLTGGTSGTSANPKPTTGTPGSPSNPGGPGNLTSGTSGTSARPKPTTSTPGSPSNPGGPGNLTSGTSGTSASPKPTTSTPGSPSSPGGPGNLTSGTSGTSASPKPTTGTPNTTSGSGNPDSSTSGSGTSNASSGSGGGNPSR